MIFSAVKFRELPFGYGAAELQNMKGDGPFYITCNGMEETYDIVLLATGGITYPKTGSRGDGYRFAQAYGHEITEQIPVLVAFQCAEDACARMQGLTLKNVRLKLYSGKSGFSITSAKSYLRIRAFPVRWCLQLRRSCAAKPCPCR